MTSEKNQKLEELRSKFKEAKKVRDDLNACLRSKRDSIMGIYSEIDKLLKEAKRCKESRDKANKKVSSLKDKRDETNSKIAELNKKAAELRSVKSGGVSRREYEKLKKDYDALNWKIQTSPIAKGKEEAMIRRLEELELRIKEYEALKPTEKEAVKLEKDLKKIRTEADGYHKKLLEESDSGEKAHAEMHEIYKKVDAKRAKAKKAEGEFISTKQKVDEAHKKFVDVLNELRAEEERLGIARVREKKIEVAKLKKEQKEKESSLLSELKKGGVIKTDDLLLLQDVKND
jgi:uncharacterized coiled-coil DUF342 family protein